MSAQNPLLMYELGKSRVDERLELRQFERNIRAAGPKSAMDALRRKLSVSLARLSGWVHPAGRTTAAANDTALIRLAR
ncbi:MAG: hypothetical protein IT334_08830 [Thermomicrobiales bacterium]|nr:hypothetical protein [Thermomicrobiales bacterium]